MFYVLFMCKCVLPPGVNPIAVDKYINIKTDRSLKLITHLVLVLRLRMSGSIPLLLLYAFMARFMPKCKYFID
jgi:hypothetical protein